MLAVITPSNENAAVMSAGSLCTRSNVKHPRIISASSKTRANDKASGGIKLRNHD